MCETSRRISGYSVGGFTRLNLLLLWLHLLFILGENRCVSGMDEVAQGQTPDAVVVGRLEVATYLVQGTARKEGGGERDRVDLSIVRQASWRFLSC